MSIARATAWRPLWPTSRRSTFANGSATSDFLRSISTPNWPSRFRRSFTFRKDDPPTLLIHGDKDDLVKLDNSERILDAFKKEGVPCELIVIHGAGHGFGGEQGKQASEGAYQMV